MSSSKDEYINNAIVYTLLGAFFLWIAWGLGLNQWLGNTSMGSPFAKSNFTTQYWVYLQPDNAEAKNYRVKADISRVDGEYSLDKVYWPNGGSSTFDDCQLDSKDGEYSSYFSCASDERINEDSDYRRYKIRIDTKV